MLWGLWALASVILATPTLSFGCPDGYYNTPLGVCLPNSGTVVRAPVTVPADVANTVIDGVRNDPVRLIVNPASYINRTGIPTPGDFAEFVIKNPDKTIQLLQNPGQWPYIPVAESIIAGRNAALNSGAQPVPPDVRQFLRRWYPDDLIASVRWTSRWSAVQNSIQAAQMVTNGDTQAIALINVIVFRDDAAIRDKALWAHELVHISQYRDWGVFGFAKKWVDNSAMGGPVEAPAYARGREADRVLAQQSVPIPAPGPGPIGVGQRIPGPHLTPVAAGLLPSGAQLGPCGCYGPVPPGANAPAPQCLSRTDVPRACGGMCPGGGSPWAHSCL